MNTAAYAVADAWRPASGERRLPQPGELIAWRYGVWKVADFAISEQDYDGEDDDEDGQECLSAIEVDGDVYVLPQRVYHLSVAHVSGPVLAPLAESCDDGDEPVAQVIGAGTAITWSVLGKRWQTCSCHGDVWPCQEIDHDEQAVAAMQDLDRLVGAHAPGLCAACAEVITTSTPAVAFPEPSLVAPGCPGPVFHARRRYCWYAARRYEIDWRLPAHPRAMRLASCPGILMIHKSGRPECTADGLCTGHHGPPGIFGVRMQCTDQYAVAGDPAMTPTPLTNCGFPGCQGTTGPEEITEAALLGDVVDRGFPGWL